MNDGYITIELNTVVQNAIINGMEIISETELVTNVDSELDKDQKLTIYTNPSNGIFRVKLPVNYQQMRNKSVIVYDMVGRIVFESEIVNSTIDIARNKKGIYLIQVGDFKPEKAFKY